MKIADGHQYHYSLFKKLGGDVTELLKIKYVKNIF